MGDKKIKLFHDIFQFLKERVSNLTVIIKKSNYNYREVPKKSSPSRVLSPFSLLCSYNLQYSSKGAPSQREELNEIITLGFPRNHTLFSIVSLDSSTFSESS